MAGFACFRLCYVFSIISEDFLLLDDRRHKISRRLYTLYLLLVTVSAYYCKETQRWTTGVDVSSLHSLLQRDSTLDDWC